MKFGGFQRDVIVQVLTCNSLFVLICDIWNDNPKYLDGLQIIFRFSQSNSIGYQVSAIFPQFRPRNHPSFEGLPPPHPCNNILFLVPPNPLSPKIRAVFHIFPELFRLIEYPISTFSPDRNPNDTYFVSASSFPVRILVLIVWDLLRIPGGSWFLLKCHTQLRLR